MLSQNPEAASISQTASSDGDANLVHFGDLIDVDVVGSFEFDWRGILTPEGFLDGFDKIQEQIYGLCKSEEELAAEITKEYSAALRDPKVVVKILDRSNRAVALLDGAVKLPQRFQIRRPVRLNELLIISGGLTDKASGEIRVFRPQNLNCENQKREADGDSTKDRGGNGSQNSIIKITDLLAGVKEANPRIWSGDIVTVAEASPIYLIGGFNVPKQISLRPGMTLTRAIASAGGIARDGLENRLTIYRRDGAERRMIETSVQKITANEADDPVLQAFDIVEVGQKGKARGRLQPVIEASRVDGERLSKLPLRIID